MVEESPIKERGDSLYLNIWQLNIESSVIHLVCCLCNGSNKQNNNIFLMDLGYLIDVVMLFPNEPPSRFVTTFFLCLAIII